MAISVKSGHLTATNKKVIAQMLERGLTDAKSGRITYRLSSTGKDSYKVTTEENGTNDYGKPIVRKYSATFDVR